MDFPASSGPRNGSSKSGDSHDGSDLPPKENPAGQDPHSDTDVSAKSSEIPPSVQKPKEVQNGGAEETLRKDNECLWLSNEMLSKTNRLLQEENRTLSEECKSLRVHSEALSKVNVTLKDANQTLLEENKSLRSNSEAREKSLRQEVEKLKRAEREHLKANEQLQRFYNSQRGENERLVQRNTNISFTNRQQIEALTKERDQLRAALDRQIYVCQQCCDRTIDAPGCIQQRSFEA